MADGFIFYRSFTEALRDIPAEQFKEVVLAVSDYATDGIVPEALDAFCKAMFTLIKPQIDANIKRREAGRKGGEANAKQIEANVKQNEASEKQVEPKVKDKVKEKDKEKEKTKAKEKSAVVAVATLDVPDDVRQKMQGFVDMRKEIKKPMTGHAVDLMYKRLTELSSDPVVQCKILDQSIRHSWQDVYPLKTEERSAPKNKFGNIIQHDYDMDAIEKQLLGVG